MTEEEKPAITFNLSLQHWTQQSRVDKILSVILIAAILGATGTVGYAIATPKAEDRFTEFYILGYEGTAGGYPEELAAGEMAVVTVCIVNHEFEDVRYQLEITIDGYKHNEIDEIVLGQEEKWEQEVFFTPERVGENQNVEFTLYKAEKAYRQLQLWVNVKE